MMLSSNTHSQFSRLTMTFAASVLERRFNNAKFDRYILELGIEDNAVMQGTLPHKINSLIRHAIAHPDAAALDGTNLWDAMVQVAADFAKPSPWGDLSDQSDVVRFVRSLSRDGFALEAEGLRRALPEDVDLPAADDEVHLLLKELGLQIAEGHLDQAIINHTDGNWAAANGQLRTFFEALLNSAAEILDASGTAATRDSNAKRALLANLNPPFLSRESNEWKDNGQGFVNGLFARLHPEGSHPGLSDEEDSTFRLHMVLLTARLLLRRLKSRL